MQNEIERATARRKGYRHVYLLVCLLLVIGVGPFFTKSISWILEVFLFITLVAATHVAAARPRGVLSLAGLGLLSVLARVAFALHPDQAVLLYGFLCGYIAFFAVVAISILRGLFRAQSRITPDVLCGAFSVYLIFGLVWAMAFAILENAAPGSFDFGAPVVVVERFDRFLGFSFTTLTTLGYGNVAPATPQADALTTMEAIVGQFYLAIVIARFVALQIVQATGESEKKPPV